MASSSKLSHASIPLLDLSREFSEIRDEVMEAIERGLCTAAVRTRSSRRTLRASGRRGLWCQRCGLRQRHRCALARHGRPRHRSWRHGRDHPFQLLRDGQFHSARRRETAAGRHRWTHVQPRSGRRQGRFAARQDADQSRSGDPAGAPVRAMRGYGRSRGDRRGARRLYR